MQYKPSGRIPSVPNVREYVRKYLKTDRGSVDTAAKLLSKFLRDLCAKLRAHAVPVRGARSYRFRKYSGALSQDFVGRVLRFERGIPTAAIHEICCNYGEDPDCQQVARTNVSAPLIAAMAAYWQGTPRSAGGRTSRPDTGSPSSWPAKPGSSRTSSTT